MKSTKQITRIITITLLVSVILCFCFAITHLKHDCTHNDNCPICIIIHRFKDDIKGYDPKISIIIITIISIIPPVVICLNDKNINKKKGTLVGLKVKLIN